MRIYTVTVPATLSFDVIATSQGEAVSKARKLLDSQSPVDDYGGFNRGFAAPWVIPGDPEQITVEDIFPEE